MDKIVPSFKNSIFNDSFNDAITEIAEFGIDSILDNEILRSIPVVRLVLASGRFAQNIHDRNLMRQTVVFIQALNSKEITDEELAAYYEKLTDPKKQEEELGRVLVILNRTIDIQKSQCIGNLFRNYVKKRITWEKFIEFSQIVEQIFLSDIKTLVKVLEKELTETSRSSRTAISRLEGLGLINSSLKNVYSLDNVNYTDKFVSLSLLGQEFIDNTRELKRF